MNPGLVVKLRPAGPWRIGPDSGARNRVDFIYHSDSLYSAVTSAMARLGLLDAWLDATARGNSPAVCFSSCFPFLDEIGFVVPPRTVWPPVSRALVSARVRWKSARFVPLGVVQAILAGQRLDENHWSVDGASECLVPAGQPGPFRTGVRWSAAVDRLTGATERHSTACIEFRPGAGLWTIVSFADEAAHARWLGPVKAAFRLLADTGFGGERSRGWGRAESPEFIDGSLPDMILPPPEPATQNSGMPAEGAAVPVSEQSEPPSVESPATPPPETPEPVAPVTEPPSEQPPVEEPPAEPSEARAAVRAPSDIEPLESDPSPALPVESEPDPLPAPEPGPPDPEPAPEPSPEPLSPPINEPERPAPVLALPPTEPEPPVSDPALPAQEAAPSTTEPIPPLPEPAPPVADSEPTNTEPAPPGPVSSMPPNPEPALELHTQEPALPAEPVASPAPGPRPPAPEAPTPEVQAPGSRPPAPEAQAPTPEVQAPGPRPPAPEAVHPHWLLSLFTPAPDDAVDWRRGNYTVLARGGRVDSPAGSGELKKQIQMVAEGSVVYAATGPCGTAADVAPDGFAHPVFRAGFAVSIPLPEVS
jgi:CRISPR type III-A-associated RAMP protein Csm4